MSLYNSDKEEIQEMIDEKIDTMGKEGIFSQETKRVLILCIVIVIVAILFFGTIMFTSKEKTKRINIEKFGEYNKSAEEI